MASHIAPSVLTRAESHPIAEEPHRPRLLAVIRRVSMSLLIAVVVPAVIFYSVFVLAGVWPAIIAALAWSYGAIAWRAATKRRVSGLLVLAAILLTGRTSLSVVADSTWLYFLQPIISDSVVAALFLLSLASTRPMVARLAGDFYPMDRELASRPRVRRLFWHLTMLWAVLGLAKASMTLWLLQSQSLDTFVLVKSVSTLTINVLAAFATIGLAALVARKEGLLGPTRLVIAGLRV
ncbi:VC0807 family protein [Nocardioides sp. HM23]|uniref:VC0807 family protein n=1 Tax=Nocardioides bizhenqiangii TaxID=3095076 RepID=UPI002ACA30ED|nr:VC0807 family protein [Nocardioides sp. HM23]MDZ5620992.1 VC0807 family protein [Nocardioides sp. HM23]